MSGFFLFFGGYNFFRMMLHFATDMRKRLRVIERRAISGIINALFSGSGWIKALGVHGPRKMLCNRSVRWPGKDAWTDFFHAPAGTCELRAELMIDPLAVNAYRCASCEEVGRTGDVRRQGKTITKVHALLPAGWDELL